MDKIPAIIDEPVGVGLDLQTTRDWLAELEALAAQGADVADRLAAIRKEVQRLENEAGQ